MNFSADDLNGLSQAYHEFYREHFIRGKFKNKLRSIFVNNWEGVYFNEEKNISLADCTKNLGLELLVLDDDSSLGDWFINTEKLPHGLKDLDDKVHKRGLKFEIWVEPEMVNVDSKLYRAHPDWI